MYRTLLLAIVFATSSFAADLRLQVKQLATGLAAPVTLANAGDTRMFVVLQGGRIVIWDGAQILATPFLDIRSLVKSGGEQGLLGLAFHPQYRDNGFFYINYTDLNSNTVVARYRVSATDVNRADTTSARVLLQVVQPFANHNGGGLQFGPDGYLYIGM